MDQKIDLSIYIFTYIHTYIYTDGLYTKGTRAHAQGTDPRVALRASRDIYTYIHIYIYI